MGGILINNQNNTNLMGASPMTSMKASTKSKIIKRYQNRKLYDTQQSCYVTLDDIAKMIRATEEVTVIDNKTKNDITAATLTQIIFEAEKKAAQFAPLFTLREIIQSGNGSISNYLAKLGAFPHDYITQKPAPVEPEIQAQPTSTDDLKETLENRVNPQSQYNPESTAKVAAEKASLSTPNFDNDDETPSLPTSSNSGFNN